MKTARDEFQEFEDRLYQLNQARHEIGEEISVLEDASSRLRARLIREEKVLAAHPFTYMRHYGNGSLTSKLQYFPELHQCLNFGYHDQGPLMWDGDEVVVHIRFDDNDLNFIFAGDQYIMPFIKEFGIRVDVSNLRKELDDATVKMESLRQILNNVESDFGESLEKT